MFLHPLSEVSMVELLSIWAELMECYHDVNGYGGTVAEIYSYRLQKYDPALHCGKPIKNSSDSFLKAGKSLVAIVDGFCKQYGCDAKIDGVSLEEWSKRLEFGKVIFAHRAYVKITI